MRKLYVVLILFLSSSWAQAQRADFIKNNTFVSTLSSDSAMRGSQTTFINSAATRVAGLQDLFGMQDAPLTMMVCRGLHFLVTGDKRGIPTTSKRVLELVSLQECLLFLLK